MLYAEAQGVPGAYSEEAAEAMFAGCVPQACEQFQHAFEAVERWLADRALLPVENSLGGSIHKNYDLLLKHRLHIVSEINFKVEHCLLTKPGISLEHIERVISHPQALAQCEEFLASLDCVQEAWDDTAGAAKAVADGESDDIAAIASPKAARLYGLQTLQSGIQDDPDNITRFIALGREPATLQAHAQHKTCIVFSLREGPGVLFRALSCFALRDIDLTKIESRPLRSRPIALIDPQAGGEQQQSSATETPGNESSSNTNSNNNGEIRFAYLFYIDFLSGTHERHTQNALRHLDEYATYLRVLGSYPVDNR